MKYAMCLVVAVVVAVSALNAAKDSLVAQQQAVAAKHAQQIKLAGL